MTKKMMTPVDTAIDYFETLNKEPFIKSDYLYLDFMKQWKNPPSDELKEKIRRWSTSGSRIESLFTLISFHFLEEIKKEEKKREETKNDN